MYQAHSKKMFIIIPRNGKTPKIEELIGSSGVLYLSKIPAFDRDAIVLMTDFEKANKIDEILRELESKGIADVIRLALVRKFSSDDNSKIYGKEGSRMPKRLIRKEDESWEEFLERVKELISRSKEVRIKRNKDGTIKIKFRTPSYLYTYPTKDEKEAREILALVPDELKREIL